MSRAPEPGDACRPGGSCPDCNAVPETCLAHDCENEPTRGEDYCDDCLDAMELRGDDQPCLDGHDDAARERAEA